jgi:predicted nuclease of restriction endonuclease-like (RecB) superfamily
MSAIMKTSKSKSIQSYKSFVSGIQGLLEEARHQAVRSVNAVLTATYWEIGRRIVKYEQGGKVRAGYGEELLKRLSQDITQKFGRGFGVDNLQRFRTFYLNYPPSLIYATPSRKSKGRKYATLSRKFDIQLLAEAFPLSWSHYVKLLSVDNDHAREFYQAEALRGGWSVRQLDRQINSQFYERLALSRNKASMLKKGSIKRKEDKVTAEEEIKDPYVLEFLDLKDEYSESELEEALIRHLEKFLLELGGDFTFVARQKRLRVGDVWYRVDLVFFHRILKCLVLIDLKIDTFTHADAGQMHLYLNYARKHWSHPDENPPVGLILCAKKNEIVARYALEGLSNKILASEYKMALPDARLLAKELRRTRRLLEIRTVKKVPKKRQKNC